MKRKVCLLSIVLTLCMTLNVVAVTNTGYRMMPLIDKLETMTNSILEDEVSRFSDVKDHWAREYVGKLSYLEIIGGYSDGTFKPDQKILVDEFIKLMVTAMGYTPGVGDGYWAEPYIQIAKDEKLIGSNEFSNYARPINRQEMAKIITNGTLTKEIAPDDNLLALLRSSIRDYPDIPDAYKQSVLTAYGMGLIAGTPSREFKPLDNATRAEASVVIMRFLDPAIRLPLAVDLEKATITLKDKHGVEEYVVYPPSREDVIAVAHVYQNAISKSKGAVNLYYSPHVKMIAGTFYESKAVMQEDLTNDDIPIGYQMTITIRTIDSDRDMQFPYSFVAFDTAKVKELHVEVIEELFKELFQQDADKAIKELHNLIDAALNDLPRQIQKDIILNDRYLGLNKFAGSNRFSIDVGRKGYRY